MRSAVKYHANGYFIAEKSDKYPITSGEEECCTNQGRSRGDSCRKKRCNFRMRLSSMQTSARKGWGLLNAWG